MRRVLILFSHLGSESHRLFDALSSHPRIDGFRTGLVYDHYEKIMELTSNRHKNENASSIWMDEALHNHQFTCKPLLNYVKPIFVLREPRGALNEILRNHPEFDAKRAATYYRYRLRGLCEYAHRVSNPYIVTMEDVRMEGIEEYLGIKDSIPRITSCSSSNHEVPHALLSECESCYERHLGHLKPDGI